MQEHINLNSFSSVPERHEAATNRGNRTTRTQRLPTSCFAAFAVRLCLAVAWSGDTRHMVRPEPSSTVSSGPRRGREDGGSCSRAATRRRNSFELSQGSVGNHATVWRETTARVERRGDHVNLTGFFGASGASVCADVAHRMPQNRIVKFSLWRGHGNISCLSSVISTHFARLFGRP